MSSDVKVLTGGVAPVLHYDSGPCVIEAAIMPPDGDGDGDDVLVLVSVESDERYAGYVFRVDPATGGVTVRVDS